MCHEKRTEQNRTEHNTTSSKFFSLSVLILLLSMSSGYKVSAQNFFTYSDGALLRNDSIDLAYLNHLDTIDFYDTLYKLEIDTLSSSFTYNTILINHPDYPSSGPAYLYVNSAEYEDDENYYWYGHSKIEYGDTSCIHAKLSLLREGNSYSGQLVLDTNTYIIKTLPSGAVAMFLSKTVDYSCVSTGDSLSEYDLELDDLSDSQARTLLCYVEVLIVATDPAVNANPNFMIEVREAIKETNVALSRSSIPNLRFRLANEQPVDLPANYQFFQESSPLRDIEDDRDNFQTTFQNNNFPNIGWHRDENRADIVILLTSGRYFLGNRQAFGVAGTLVADTENAFAIVDVNNIRKDKTLSHELSHILGARHEHCTGFGDHPDCNPNTGTPERVGEIFARGHRFGRWNITFPWDMKWRDYRTIMHTTPNVEDAKKNIWLDNYSNPNILVHKHPTGVTDVRDNARLLRNVACHVSDFREEAIPTNLYVSTNGPYLVCPCNYIYINSGINGSSIPSGATYLWELTFDGVNYTTVGTSSDLGYIHDCNGRYARTLLFRLTVTFPVIGQIYTYHLVEIGAYNDEGIPCAITRPTSIGNKNELQDFSMNVYPNPVSQGDELFIQLTQSSDSNKNYSLEDLKAAQIVITEISGKQINTHSVIERFSNSAISVPVTDLIPGMYMISLRFSDGRQISSKFVKQ